MKKDQSLPNKNLYCNNRSGKPLPNDTNYTRNQSPYNSSHHIGIITVTLTLDIDTEVVHQNIKDTVIKCKQMK